MFFNTKKTHLSTRLPVVLSSRKYLLPLTLQSARHNHLSVEGSLVQNEAALFGSFGTFRRAALLAVSDEYLGLRTDVVLILTAQLVAEQGNELVTLGVGEAGHHELGSHERGIGVRHLVGYHGIVQRRIPLGAALLFRRGFGGSGVVSSSPCTFIYSMAVAVASASAS